MRDIGKLHFIPWKERWQDQSVSYPSVIRTGGVLRMYYCGNDYGCGGIGTAVASPMRIALTGETRGGAKLWIMGDDTLYSLKMFASVSTEETGPLGPGGHEEGITHNGSVFFEEFPEKDGTVPFSMRAILVHERDGIRFDVFAENRTDISYEDVRVAADPGTSRVRLTSSDAEITAENGRFILRLGALPGRSTVCRHVRIFPVHAAE